MSLILPRLKLRHEPGWRLQTSLFDPDDLIVFDSRLDTFHLTYGIDLFKTGTVSSSLAPSSCCELLADPTPDQLANLGNWTDLLQEWLDDCAEALDWTQRHKRQLLDLWKTRKPANPSGGPTT